MIRKQVERAVLAAWVATVSGIGTWSVVEHYRAKHELNRLDAAGGADVYRSQRAANSRSDSTGITPLCHVG